MSHSREPTPTAEQVRLPFEQVVQDINLWKDTISDPVWVAGHGTHHNNPDDFFRDGLVMHDYDDVFSTVLPIDTDDTEALKNQFDHWPHLDAGRIVMLAGQMPHRLEGLGERHSKGHFWQEGHIQKTERYGREVNHVPTDWVMGVYDRSTGMVTMNPHFTGREVTKADIDTSQGHYSSMWRSTDRIIQQSRESDFVSSTPIGGMSSPQGKAVVRETVIVPKAPPENYSGGIEIW